jgi:hypothetical protein
VGAGVVETSGIAGGAPFAGVPTVAGAAADPVSAAFFASYSSLVNTPDL